MPKIKRKISITGDAFSIANRLGEPWTQQAWHTEIEAERYLRQWQKDTKIDLPKHKVVPVRVTVRFTNASFAALKRRK